MSERTEGADTTVCPHVEYFIPRGGKDDTSPASSCPSETSVGHISAIHCVQRSQGSNQDDWGRSWHMDGIHETCFYGDGVLFTVNRKNVFLSIIIIVLIHLQL